MPHSVLVVPVPELDELVAHAHITLLPAFAGKDELGEGLLGELEELFADCLPFGFQLAQVAQFPGGATYLAPEPVAPFRTLTHELSRHYPEYAPRTGGIEVPHLTVPDGFRLESPLTAYAVCAALWQLDEGAVDLLATFPFGTTAA